MIHQVFQCDSCPETFEKVTDAIEHNIECVYNPKNKKCFSCIHSMEEEGIVICGAGKSEEEALSIQTTPLLKCQVWEKQ